MKQINLFEHEMSKEYKWNDGAESHFNFFPIENSTSVIIGANNSRKSRFLRYIFKENGFLISNKNIKYVPKLIIQV